MSEMKTANPRIPSPFDTAGIFADSCPHSGLLWNNKPTLDSLSRRTGEEDGQSDVQKELANTDVQSLLAACKRHLSRYRLYT